VASDKNKGLGLETLILVWDDFLLVSADEPKATLTLANGEVLIANSCAS
jgi:hypothetical protein